MDDKDFEKYLDGEEGKEEGSWSEDCLLLNLLRTKTKATSDFLHATSEALKATEKEGLKKVLEDHIMMLIQSSKSDIAMFQEMAENFINPDYEEDE